MAVLPSIILWGSVVLAVAYYIRFRISRRKMYEMAAKIPGRPMMPLIGNAHQFAGDTAEIFDNIKRVIDHCYENGGISRIWLGPRLYIAIAEPKGAEAVLNTEMKKANVYKFLKPWLGNGLVTSSVSVWRKHRKMLSPSFNQKILDGFVEIFAEQCSVLIKKMSVEIGKGHFDIFKYVSLCTLDIVCESAMGVKVGSQNNNNTSYVQASLKEMNIVYRRMFQIWLQIDFIFNLTKYKKEEIENIKIMHEFTDKVVKKKRMDFDEKQNASDQNSEYNDESTSKRLAFLDSILYLSRHSDKFTDVELREEVDTMTITGNDTSAHASCYVFTILANLPHIQEKVVEELREIYGDSDRPVVKEDLPKMQYLERVIKETLRLFPIAPIIVRTLTQDIKLEKYTIPAGCDAAVAVWGLHRDRKVWGENVDEFDPDRFLKENSANRHPYSYIPFSAGPRNCIGKQYAMMSMKSLVSTVLRAYKLRTDMDFNKMRLRSEILLKPINGYLLTVEPRKNLSQCTVSR